MPDQYSEDLRLRVSIIAITAGSMFAIALATLIGAVLGVVVSAAQNSTGLATGALLGTSLGSLAGIVIVFTTIGLIWRARTHKRGPRRA